MTDAVKGIAGGDRASSTWRPSRLGRGPALVRVQVAPRHGVELMESIVSPTSRRRWSSACSRPASPPARTSSTSCRSAWRRRRRGRRPTRGRTRRWTAYDALAEPAHGRELLRRIDAQQTIETEEGEFSFKRVELSGARRRRGGAADRRGAVELVARVRRRAGDEGLPQAGGRAQPRARAAPASSPRAVPEHRPALRLVRVRRALARHHAGRRPAVLPRWRRRLGAGAGGDRHRSGAFLPESAAWARSRAAAQRAGLRRQRPRLLPGGAQRRGDVAAHRDSRRGHRARLRAPARR